jgi:serine/threonine protein kinase
MIGTQIKDYSFSSIIGKGGMATIYLAEHNTLHKPVAIKVLNKEFAYNVNIRKRFVAEARNMFTMNHPNVVRITDLIDQDDIVAFVMEYVEGETLRAYLDIKGKLSNDAIKKFFTQMLDAVGYVHEKGFVHRDIKPSNFIINSEGVVKLLDFGIAKNTDKNSAEYTQTGTNQNMGTPMYMSPEQIKSTKGVTAQSDIYSLGVVFWQMVMGTKPYDTETISTWELQTKIVNEPLPPTSTKWDSLVQLATSKDLSTRYESANVFQQEISKLLSQGKHSPKPVVERKTVAEETIIDTRNTPNSEETVLIDKAVSEEQTVVEYEVDDSSNSKKGPVKLDKDNNGRSKRISKTKIQKHFPKKFNKDHLEIIFFQGNIPKRKFGAFSKYFEFDFISNFIVYVFYYGSKDCSFAIGKNEPDEWYLLIHDSRDAKRDPILLADKNGSYIAKVEWKEQSVHGNTGLMITACTDRKHIKDYFWDTTDKEAKSAFGALMEGIRYPWGREETLKALYTFLKDEIEDPSKIT